MADDGSLAARTANIRAQAFTGITALGGHITVIRANADEWLIKAVPPKGKVWAANGSRSFVTTIGAYAQDGSADHERLYMEWSRVLRVIMEGIHLQAVTYPRLRIFKHEGGDWCTAIKYGPKVEGDSYAFSSSHAEALGYATDRIKGGYPKYRVTAQVQG